MGQWFCGDTIHGTLIISMTFCNGYPFSPHIFLLESVSCSYLYPPILPFLAVSLGCQPCYNAYMNNIVEKTLIKYAPPALLILLGGWFALWAFGAGYSVAAMAAALFSAGLFGLCLAKLPPYLQLWLSKGDPIPPQAGLRASRFDRRHPWAAIALRIVLLHIILYAAAYIFDLEKNGYSGGMLDTMARLWNRTDAPHYQGIAQNWYVTEGDPRFHIVFFPLYPLLIKAFNFIIGNYFASALVVSNLCSIGCGIMAYELAALDMERRDALFTAAILSVFPGSFFLAAPMTESLFLLLSLSCMFCARKKKYLLAGGFGALAAFTRSVGLLLVLPVFIEALGDYFRNKPLGTKAIASRLCGTAMIVLGTLGYLLINHLVTGSALTFLTYQREHWSQGLGPFFGTAAYQTDLLIKNLIEDNPQLAYGLFLPNLLCAFVSLALLFPAMKRLRPSYSGYALVYFAVTIGCTWLLSGPRYLAVCFPIAFGIAELTKGKKFLRTAALMLLGTSMLVYLWMFVTGYPVY